MTYHSPYISNHSEAQKSNHCSFVGTRFKHGGLIRSPQTPKHVIFALLFATFMFIIMVLGCTRVGIVKKKTPDPQHRTRILSWPEAGPPSVGLYWLNGGEEVMLGGSASGGFFTPMNGTWIRMTSLAKQETTPSVGMKRIPHPFLTRET